MEGDQKMDGINKECPPKQPLQETQCIDKSILVYRNKRFVSSNKHNSHVNEQMKRIFEIFFDSKPNGEERGSSHDAL